MAELEDEISSICSEIHEFKIGTFENFHDAMEGEMEGCCVNIVFFGIAGSGKSALINTIFQSLGYKDMTPAVTQTTGKEGTKVLDRFFLPGNPIGLIDTRGYFSMDTKEEGRSFLLMNFNVVDTEEDWRIYPSLCLSVQVLSEFIYTLTLA